MVFSLHVSFFNILHKHLAHPQPQIEKTQLLISRKIESVCLIYQFHLCSRSNFQTFSWMSPAFAPTSCVPEKPRFSYISFNLEKCLNLSENSHIYIYIERERERERERTPGAQRPRQWERKRPRTFFP